jgi:hypothetical protein
MQVISEKNISTLGFKELFINTDPIQSNQLCIAGYFSYNEPHACLLAWVLPF